MWVRVGQCGSCVSEWVGARQSGSERVRVIQCVSVWVSVGQSGSEWVSVGQSGSVWVRVGVGVGQSGSEWSARQSGSAWVIPDHHKGKIKSPKTMQ